jgi:discoidin domain receptor family protein 2
MVQGDSRGPGVEFLDDTYDGVTSANNTLSGGLGQLTDHEVGYYNFRLDLQGVGKKGYEWVGWRNDTRPPNTPIEITFEFDRVRNFTSVRLHVNNMFTKEVRVFRRAELFFSVGGRYYVSEPIVYEPLRDVVIEFARYVTIPLPQMHWSLREDAALL